MASYEPPFLHLVVINHPNNIFIFVIILIDILAPAGFQHQVWCCTQHPWSFACCCAVVVYIFGRVFVGLRYWLAQNKAAVDCKCGLVIRAMGLYNTGAVLVLTWRVPCVEYILCQWMCYWLRRKTSLIIYTYFIILYRYRVVDVQFELSTTVPMSTYPTGTRGTAWDIGTKAENFRLLTREFCGLN